MNASSNFARQAAAILVRVASTNGSVPREVGACMAVFPDSFKGTIGGGHLEFEAIREARSRLQGKDGADIVRYALGPALGQCCGGVVHLAYKPLSSAELQELPRLLRGPMTDVAVFGGGHVGTALVEILAKLPYRINWIDSRDDVLPLSPPPGGYV